MPSRTSRLLIRRLLGVTLVCLATVTTASAHNRWVHQKSTEAAYIIMWMGGWPEFSAMGFSRPPEVPAAEQQEWETFLKRIHRAAVWLSEQPSQLPKPSAMDCGDGINGGTEKGLKEEEATAMTGPLKDVPFSITNDYLAGGGCGLSLEKYLPGGMLDHLKIDKSGNVLGMWTGWVDKQIDDTHLMWRLTNMPGVKEFKDGLDKGYKAGAEPIVVPVYCAVKCFLAFFGIGSCNDCIKGAKQIVDSKDPVKEADNLIPGVGVDDFTDGELVGLWHHQKAQGPHSDTYDVAQGYFTDEAYLGHPGPTELVAMALMDTLGFTVDYAKSQGTTKYQIYGAKDGHPDSVKRGAEDWQWTTWPHVPFSPVDNLGYYGWAQFRDDPKHPVSSLGYPLHAIDDSSTAPHIAGTFSWGHAAFEDAEEALWPRTLFHDTPTLQYGLVNSIVSMAYAKYRWIQQWRQQNNGTTDVPFRILASDLAAATSKLIDASPSKPFDMLASELKLLGGVAGGDAAAREVFTSDPVLLEMVVRPATAMGLAVKIAFLLAAVERVAPDKVQP